MIKHALEKDDGKVDVALDKLMNGVYDNYKESEIKQPSEVINWSEKKKFDYQKDLLVPFEDENSSGLVANQFKQF